MCDNGGCIDQVAKCNGVQDCTDNSDEYNCGKLGIRDILAASIKLLRIF